MAIGGIFSNFMDDIDNLNSSDHHDYRLQLKYRLRDAVFFHTSAMR